MMRTLDKIIAFIDTVFFSVFRKYYDRLLNRAFIKFV